MKKILFLALAAAMALGTAVQSFAADTDYLLEYHKDSTVTTGDIDLGDSVRPGDSVSLEIPQALIEEIAGAGATYVTKQDLKTKGILAKRTIAEGEKAFSGVSISTRDVDEKDGGNGNIIPAHEEAYIKLSFVSEFVGTKDIDFRYNVHLIGTKDIKLNRDTTGMIITGTFGNATESVFDGDKHAYSADKTVIIAEDYIKELEIDLGKDLSAVVTAFRGNRYYGTCTNAVKDEDDAIISKHPEFAGVYYIKQVGLEKAQFKFDLNEKFYVYSADGTALGTTDGTVAYSSKYYLTSAPVELDLAKKEEAKEEATGEEAVEVQATAATTPVTENNNPETGLSGAQNVAVALGVVLLAAAGAMGLRS